MATPLIARRTVAASAGASLSRRMMGPTSASTVSITQSSRALHSLVGGQRKPVNGRVMSASRDVRLGAARGIFNRLAGGQGDLVKKEEPEVPARSINFDVASRIEGGETQIAVIDLEPGQTLRAETGSLIYMTDGVEIDTSLGGGMGSGFKRMMTGQNVFISDFKYTGPEGFGTVALGSEYPSKILRVSLSDYAGALICQKGAFMCGTHDLGIEMEFTRNFKTGFFGGEGFVLQRLTAQPGQDADAFIKAGGTLIRRELREGETLKVTSGSLVAFAPSVSYDVQMMKGVKNIMFGSEGLFLTTLTGPGTVFLQSMPFDRLVGHIAARVPGGRGFGMGVPVGAAAGSEAAGAGEEGDGGEAGEDSAGGEEDLASGSTASARGFGDEAAAASSGSSGSSSSDDVWKEEGSSGEGGDGDMEEGAAEASEGVGEVIRDFFGSIWGDK